jgi:hypothetical protein
LLRTHGSVAVVEADAALARSAVGRRRPTVSVVHKVVCGTTIAILIVDGVRSTLLRPDRSREVQ